MGIVVCANNTKLAVAGVSIGKLKTLNFSHSRDVLDVTTIDSTSGWREFIAGMKGGTSISGTLMYTPDLASHAYVNGGLVGNIACWNLLTNPSFGGAVGATTCYGWTEVGACDTHTISSTQKHDGDTSWKLVESGGGAAVGWSQTYEKTEAVVYYASIWVYPETTAGSADGVNWTISDEDETIYQVFPTQASAWSRLTKTFTSNATDTLTFFIGGNGTAYWDGAMLVASSVLTDFHASDQDMTTYTITLPEADGGTCTVTGYGRLTKFDAKAVVGEALESDFEIITSGAATFTYNVT